MTVTAGNAKDARKGEVLDKTPFLARVDFLYKHYYTTYMGGFVICRKEISNMKRV